MRRNTLCSSVTTSSTVAGRPGSYWDMPYLKVSHGTTKLQSVMLNRVWGQQYKVFMVHCYNNIFYCEFTGVTAYVLTESPTGIGHWLWNPHTGKHYTQHEPYTPLTSVGCAINEENVRFIVARLWH